MRVVALKSKSGYTYGHNEWQKKYAQMQLLLTLG